MTMSFAASAARVKAASALVPGGVNSNFRLGISPTPLVIERGEGPFLFDIDGNRLIDYYLGMGPMILGHNPPQVIQAVKAQLEHGLLFAAQSEVEYEAARLVNQLVPCAERVRFNCSGSEAVQAALRLARAATGRAAIVKFEGHYHGWFDNVVWSVAPQPPDIGERDAPGHVAGTPGQDANAGIATEVMVWNDLERLERRLRRSDVAGLIMEPIMCNTSAIMPHPGYLEGVRRLCSETGTVLIFDEVITGFGRLGASFATEYFGVKPDLITTAKGLTNGTIPMGAVFARAGIYDAFMSAPEGTIELFHGYTYSGHPVAAAAGLATLDIYREEGLFENAAALSAYWEDAVHSLKGLPHVIDLRNLGLVAGIELEPIPGKPTARAMQAMQKAFEAGVLIRTTSDIIALSPPLIVQKAHIDEIFGTLAEVLKTVH